IPGTESLGSCSFFVYLRPAKNEKSGQSREAFSRSHGRIPSQWRWPNHWWYNSRFRAV
ncbi:hypothetical protein BDM02DRAFT_3123127, partial [Thelephora ganbajun]